MKIMINNKLNYYTTPADISKQLSNTSGQQKLSRNFDAITIRSAGDLPPDKTFAAALSKKISSEVRNTASPQKMEELKTQITNGTYQIDVSGIVEKIMLG